MPATSAHHDQMTQHGSNGAAYSMFDWSSLCHCDAMLQLQPGRREPEHEMSIQQCRKYMTSSLC